MDEDKKQKVKIVFVAVCLILAVVVYLLKRVKSFSTIKTKRTMQMLCANEECNAEYEVTPEQYRETMVPSGGPGSGMVRDLGPRRFVCRECGEESAFLAMKCTRCGFVFTQNYDDTTDYSDRCPECDYSAIEDRQSKQ